MRKFRIFKIVILSFGLIILLCHRNFGQNKKNAVNDSVVTAPVNVSVMNMKKVIQKGELVLFISQKNNRQFSGRSDANGKFSILLPAGDTYIIKLKTLVDTSKYGMITIPALQPGESFQDPFKVNIQFEPARLYTLNNVHFDIGKPTLRQESYTQLDEIAEYMKWKDTDKFEIGGHTDNVGNETDNLKLSQQRADAVRDYLLKKGIPPARITAKGYGASKPVADNDTVEGRQQNRRTEVAVF